ncbi:A-kinase anchor protein 14 [Pseudonaja textilis]|uniref:A-kinase anchor protein 14 n=1 Tax=Pseudonaja textilis TaxID=8673 RepID=UPI000EA9A442|nr:A-kinase anchor protein 14 [Pseudonaja textilis]
MHGYPSKATLKLKTERTMSLEEKYIIITEDEEDEEEEEDIQEAATSVVGRVVKDAVDQIVALQKEEAGAQYKMRNITWMRCTDFSIGKGLLQIEDYMKTWELHESWLHWSNYLNKQELQYSTQYYYRVRWSIPTCRKPIPRATACVYFVIEISKIKPKMLPIEVFFVVETNKLVHRPGKTRFKEKWLKDVIESKIVMMETVDF